MMRRLFLALLVLHFLTTGFTQDQKKSDSLISVLASIEVDSVRLFVLQQIITASANPDSTIKYAKVLLSSTDDEKYTIDAYYHLGTGNRAKGNLEESLEYLFLAAKLSEETNDYSNLGHSYSELASTFSKSGDFRNSMDYNNRAVEVFRLLGDRQTLALTLLNTGYQYYNQQVYDTSLMYYNEAEQILDSIGLDIGVAYTIGNRALVKWKTGSSIEAIRDLKEAIAMLLPLGDDYGMADYHNQLGNIFYELGDLQNATFHLSTGVRMAQKVDLKEQIRDASKLLSQIFQDQSNTDSAYIYLRQYLSMRDSIANEEIITRLANQRADYEINLKQVEVDLVNQQKENRQILAIAMGAVALLAAIFLVNFYLAYQKRKKLSLKLEALNTTKDKFFSIVSHDLRGPISAFSGISSIIRGYLKQKSYNELEEMTDLIDKSANSLSDLLDNLLNWAVQQQGQVPYNPTPIDLNQILETTLGIFETAASAKNITLSNDIGRSVFVLADKDTTMTIFRNLVGNALKFTKPEGKIWVDAETKDGQVHVKVNDTGIGMSEAQVTKLFSIKDKRSYGTEGETGLGVGLQLVNEFIALNKGTLHVESKEGEGSCFIVSLPVPDVNNLK